MAIQTFSQPASELPYPAITICRRQKFDTGEYLRAVFDNFQFGCVAGSDKCSESALLRQHYVKYLNPTKRPVRITIVQNIDSIRIYTYLKSILVILGEQLPLQ